MSLDPEVKRCIEEALREAILDKQILSRDDAKALVRETLCQTWVTMGVTLAEDDDCIEMQADFRLLRNWRKSVESVKQKSLITAVGIIVAGVLGMILLGITTFLSNGGK
jgi:preprotein translocase subunit Sss1